MSIFVLLLLGVVQGLCEFLPISSSGHLVLLSKVFKIEDSLFVSIVLHFATLLAVVIVMHKEIWYIIRHPFSKEAMSVVISTIMTCLVAIVLMPMITASFEGILLPLCFLLSAVLLLLSERLAKGNKEIDHKKAALIGLAQGVAIFPGLSRSGTTIAAGLLSGSKKEDCARFSFLISLPVIAGSLILEIIKIFFLKEAINVNVPGLILGFVAAFVVGLASIKFMLKLTEKLKFRYFAIYLVIIAIISAIIMW